MLFLRSLAAQKHQRYEVNHINNSYCKAVAVAATYIKDGSAAEFRYLSPCRRIGAPAHLCIYQMSIYNGRILKNRLSWKRSGSDFWIVCAARGCTDCPKIRAGATALLCLTWTAVQRRNFRRTCPLLVYTYSMYALLIYVLCSNGLLHRLQDGLLLQHKITLLTP